MAKASPIIRSFNGGEFSPLVEGRTDLDRYPASCRSMLNYVAAPQGPAVPRSGTFYLGDAFDHARRSELIPFIFDEGQSAENAQVLEFSHQKLRFYDEAGLLVYTPVDITVTSTSPFQIDSATLSAEIGDQVVFVDFPPEYNLNAVQGEITAKASDTYTIDLTWPTGLSIPTGVKAARVYAIDSPYDEDELTDINNLQSLDVIYLTNLQRKPYKVIRKDTYDWEFEEVVFSDGPYMDVRTLGVVLTANATGRVTAGTPVQNGGTGANAFDGDRDTYWQSSSNQVGHVGLQATTPFVCRGYSIRMATVNSNTSYTNQDYAPGSWTFEGSNDGSNWDILDTQLNYVAYDSNKTAFFNIDNTATYEYYRINISECTRNGPIPPRVAELVLASDADTSITLTASAVTSINNGQGFLSTDIGRLIRVQGTDTTWRHLRITAVNSTTEIECELLGEPLPDLNQLNKWRLGYYSDTTGYPNYAAFHQDRLWWGGSDVAPDLLAGSVVGDYENLQQSTPDGEVLDTNAVVIRLNSRKLSRVRWMAESNRGLLVGTGSEEYVVTSREGSGKQITAETVQADRSTSRGSSKTMPVAVDDQVVYVQRSGRTVREYAYVFEADNFRSPSMSLLSNHLGIHPFVKLEYAAEPYSIIWALRNDGTLVGLTYNREENVVGWHRHDFEGDFVESIAVIPAEDQLQDVLFLAIKRTVNGQTFRYIERLTRFWDFDMTIEDAHYVDSAVKYEETTPTVDFYGLQHLEGKEVYGLADNLPVGPLTVQDGKVQLALEASNVLLGLGFDAEGETSRLENGARDGTSMGKEKRINNISVMLWQSYGGELGTWNEDRKQVELVPVEYPEDLSQVSDIELFDGIISDITPELGYEKRGSISFKRPKESPLPFILVALMPQMNTQDR